MAEYSRLAKGVVSSTGGMTPVNLPFQPDYVELTNFTEATTPTSGGIPFVVWDNNMGQGAAVYETFNATPVLTTATTLTGGISTFAAGLSLQYGPTEQIASITKANPAVVTTAAAHGYVTGDVVIFTGLYETTTTGMPQLSNMPFVVTVTGTTTFTIPWNTNQSNYTALSGSPAGAYVRQVLYPFLYAPGVSFISALTLSSSTTVVTTAPHNLSLGSEVAFRIPPQWGPIQLNSLPNVLIPGSPIYGFVTSVTNSTTVVVNINSTGYTAFNTNQAVASLPGLAPPQMVAVGDVNTGSHQFAYNPPLVNGIPTINGPAIAGAFVNNTSQGFIIGPTIAGAAADVIYWRALLHDYSYPSIGQI
jgi:uncharacterized membrane protein